MNYKNLQQEIKKIMTDKNKRVWGLSKELVIPPSTISKALNSAEHMIPTLITIASYFDYDIEEKPKEYFIKKKN